MNQINSDQFKAAVELDPAWASKLEKPVEITGHCDMDGSEITHLSPLLHFTGKDKGRHSANFFNCNFLKVAEGKFEGFVNFSYSNIEKIGDLSCGKDKQGNSADFFCCKALKIAEGKFEGHISFSWSGIKKIGSLSCGTNKKGYSANFSHCESLAVAEGKFEGSACFDQSGIEKIGDLSCGKNNSGIRLDVKDCPNLAKIPLTFNPKEICADPELIKKLEVDRFIQKKREQIVEIII